jgi:hypothetical protein
MPKPSRLSGTGRSVLGHAELSEVRQAGEDDAVIEDQG